MTSGEFAARVEGVELAGGEFLAADLVVLATNFHAVQRWIPAEVAARDARFAGLEQLETAPIVGAHLWFDRPVMRESHAAMMSGPLQWVFRKSPDGSAVHGVISAAREWVDVSKEKMIELFERQIRGIFPLAKDARMTRGVIVVEKRATFAPTPGVDRARPAQAPALDGIQNLILAGDYTRTGWPATMEGAVRSGYLAADAVAARCCPTDAAGKTFLVDDLPVQWPARLLGLGG